MAVKLSLYLPSLIKLYYKREESMKRIFKIFTLVVAMVLVIDASAQQVVKQRIGVYREGGDVVISEATTTLVVDLVTEHEVFKPGPYARYAQKLLGTRASLVARDEYRLISADVAVLKEPAYYATEPGYDDCATCPHHRAPIFMGHSPLPIDRVSSTEMGSESAAAEAAEHIFNLRQVRLEIVTGEHGDGVYGGGLESALREIDKLERGYLQLFYGSSEVTTTTERIEVAVNGEQKTTIVARFSPTEGIVDSKDLAGDLVMVVINPSDMSYPESNPKGTVAYRYANNCEVMVMYGQERLARRILPIYEFGATVMFLNPTK